MPFWSYGNRLYISTFYEENEETNKNELKFGFYRNTSRYTFRKWTQSWPLYRRHIYLTSKFLTGMIHSESFDDLDQEAMTINNSLPQKHPLKVDYINPKYWSKRGKEEKLYWAGLDLEKFYPNVKLSAVKDIMEKYLAIEDVQFFELMDRLLDFQIDLIGWSEEELKEIQIQQNIKSYKNIPTGLFIAGFLANVALLEIDSKISEKLKSNKNIAHFRYVDDHVIIANSFDELLGWIKEYEIILKESNIFTKEPINWSKTEPLFLAEFLSNKKEGAKEGKLYKKAKIECEVDPEFPSPLMTQTLSKVSKIAGTEFQLLDPEEQKGLISDIEHLLITEFPDNELRRDTRISFAASMLTSLVPKISIDESKVYDIHKEIFNLKRSIQNVNIVQNIDKKKLDELKSKITSLEKKLKQEELVISNAEKKIVSRTIRLLSKSVRENHQKVRLWTRLIEFCYKSGSPKEYHFLEEIERLAKNKESTTLSNSYIYSLVFQVLTNQLVMAYKVISNERVLYRTKERAINFLLGVVKERFLNKISFGPDENLKFYQKITLDTFKFTLGSIIYLIKEKNLLSEEEITGLQIDYHGLINWSKHPKLFTDKTSHTFEEWVWWFTNKISSFDNNAPSDIWYLAINDIDIHDEVGQSVISQFPKYLPITVISKIDKLKNIISVFQNEGWIFDLYKGIVEREINIGSEFLELSKRKFKKYEKHIRLDEWIEWTNDRQQNSQSNADTIFFDPRLGEWVALEIIKQIAEEVRVKSEIIKPDKSIIENINEADIFLRSIHPHNFKITKRIIENEHLSWEDTRNILKSYGKVEFIARENFVFDSRFSLFGNIPYSFSQKIESAIGSLGCILICLLSKNMDLPSKWNPIGHQFLWLEVMNNRLGKIPVSSYTRDIISGCFSKRNLETKRLIQDEINIRLRTGDDFKKDPPRFITIGDFIDYVKLSQDFLRKQQLSVSENQPRQLIPISLVQMKNDHYQSLIEEIE